MHFKISLLTTLISYSVVIHANQVVVEVIPDNKAVKDNIEAYIGSFEDQNIATLLRLQSVIKEKATTASQALGYYDTQVHTRISGRKSKNPTLKVKVLLGSPIRLQSIDIKILGPATTLEAFKNVGHKELIKGAILNQGAYDATKSQIKSQALYYGFFWGEFTKHQLLINPEEHAADVNLTYESGPRASLGKVTFNQQQNPFKDDLLYRFVNFKEGTPYNADLIAQLNNNLQSSGYFETVRIDALPIDKEHTEIPVSANVIAAKSKVLSVGAGFSTDLGPRAQLDWERPWINSSGHKLGFTTEVSQPRQSISAWYQIPMENPLTDNIRFISGLQHEDIVDTESTLYTLGVERNKKLSNGWMRTIFLRWQDETYDIDHENATRMFLMPGFNFSYLKADNNIDPSQGYRLQFGLSGAKQNVLSAADFIRYTGSAKGLYTFASRHRFFSRVEVGGIDSPNYSKIPPSLRFYAGGDQSIRGYNYQTLSPKDKYGKRVGGRYMLAGSLEYQYQFAEKWRAATFIDKGNASNSWNMAFKTGVGVGIRWISPVGPIRVDLAHGVEDHSIRLHFSMGPEL